MVKYPPPLKTMTFYSNEFFKQLLSEIKNIFESNAEKFLNWICFCKFRYHYKTISDYDNITDTRLPWDKVSIFLRLEWAWILLNKRNMDRNKKNFKKDVHKKNIINYYSS